MGPSWAGTPHAFPFGWRSLSLSFYLYLAGLIILAVVLADKYDCIFIDPFLLLGSPSPGFLVVERSLKTLTTGRRRVIPYIGCYPLSSLSLPRSLLSPILGFRQGVISCILALKGPEKAALSYLISLIGYILAHRWVISRIGSPYIGSIRQLITPYLFLYGVQTYPIGLVGPYRAIFPSPS